MWKKSRSMMASQQARKYRIWLFQSYILVAILAFLVLACLANLTDYSQFDLVATQKLQEEMPSWLAGVMIAISWPGYLPQAILMVLIGFVLLALLGLKVEAIVTLFAALSTNAINYLVKIAIQRPRPSADLVEVFSNLSSYSFPSGHVMFYTAYFGFLMFLAFVLNKHSIRRSLAILFFLCLILLIGLSRMYLGEHWASDVIGGYLLGSLTLILSIQVYRWRK